MSTGKFISLEGSEGVGKSTNLEFVRAYLERKGLEVVVTREPGGTPMAEEIRELLLKPRDEKVDHTAELLLMFAARAQHLNTHIKPALERGAWVLCDRFTDATFAYQGGGRRLGVESVRSVNDWALDGRWPDVVVLLDCPPGEGPRGRPGNDRLEQEAVDFHEAVRTTYLAVAEAEPNRFIVLPALGSIDEVAERVWAALTDRFEWDDAGRGGR